MKRIVTLVAVLLALPFGTAQHTPESFKAEWNKLGDLDKPAFGAKSEPGLGTDNKLPDPKEYPRLTIEKLEPQNGSSRPRACVLGGHVAMKKLEDDGDHHFVVEDEKGRKLVCEIVPDLFVAVADGYGSPPLAGKIKPPNVGDVIDVWGIVRWDNEHKWSEIHPVVGWILKTTKTAEHFTAAGDPPAPRDPIPPNPSVTFDKPGITAKAGQWVIVPFKAVGGVPKWSVPSVLTEIDPSIFGGDPAKAKAKLFAVAEDAKAGQYTLLAWNAQSDVASDLAACTITIGELPRPPPGPPEPPPGPPPAPTVKPAWAIVVENRAIRTIEIAVVLGDTAGWNALGLRWHQYDVNEPWATSAQVKQVIASTGLPALLLLDAGGKFIRGVKLPGTMDGVKAEVSR